jgi:hypothetical protein
MPYLYKTAMDYMEFKTILDMQKPEIEAIKD